MNLAVAAFVFLANWILKCWASGPVVIPPSEYFEGNDGPWSTFYLRVGSPEQHVRVTVSTASPQTLVVSSEFGCSTRVFGTVPANCSGSRGTLYNPNASTSWDELGLFGVGSEENLGYYQPAEYALESLGLGLTGPRLDNQIVAAIATTKPFYLGIFGLNDQPLNFTSLGNTSASSFLTSLNDYGMIPSLSWSYTAGARYRLKQEYGQLIFSGYDTSRFVENNVTFTMTDNHSRDLVVYLQSIDYFDGKSGSALGNLLSTPIPIFIDSTDPNFWLPDDVCNAFEQAFGLTADKSTGLYLINDTHHNTLLNSNNQVTFRLSDVSVGGQNVTITLPYNAFDLTAENPLVQSTSYYFPLKRAANSTQYTLGRAFLQEAYLSADYERRTFNVSACAWVEGAEENVITILPKGDQSNNDPPNPREPSQSHPPQSSTRTIVGIVIGTVAALSILAGLVLRYWPWIVGRKKASTSKDRSSSIIDGKYRKAELDTEGNEIMDTRTHELDSVGKIHELSGESQPGELAGSSTSAEMRDTQIAH